MKFLLKSLLLTAVFLFPVVNVNAWNYNVQDIMDNITSSSTYNTYHNNTDLGTTLDYIYSGSNIGIEYSIKYSGVVNFKRIFMGHIWECINIHF